MKINKTPLIITLVVKNTTNNTTYTVQEANSLDEITSKV